MELDLVRIFVRVAQLGSFSKAAESLKLPKSTVSRAVRRIEDRSATQLLLRTTRSLTLTQAGQAFYESSFGAIQALEEAGRALAGRDQAVTGLVRITAAEDLGAHVITPAIARLSREHPGISFEISYTDEIVDLVRDGFDLAFRLGPLPPSRFKARKLGTINLIAVASPAYLKAHGAPRQPVDLASHACLVIYAPDGPHPKWSLQSRGRTARISLKPRIVVNAMSSLVALAAQGAGIAFVPQYLAQAMLDSGRLVRVLPEWSDTSYVVSGVSPMGTAGAARTRLVAQRLFAEVEAALAGK